MGGKTKLCAAAVALGAISVVTTSVPASGGGAGTAGRSGNTAAIGELTKRPIRGIVQAVQSGSRLRAGVLISLHGLEPDTPYLVVQSRLGCGRSSGEDQDGTVDGADFLVWRVNGSTTGRNLFGRTRVGLRTAVSTARAVKVYDMSNPRRPVRKACGLIDVWEHA
jgi:hypothetical protein